MMAAATSTTPSVHEKNEALVTGEGDNAHRPSGRFGLTRDLVAAVPSFGVNRKKRMARQRRSSSTIKLLSFTNSSWHVPPPTRVIDPKRLRFLFQKELKNSDVSSLRRMILPKVSTFTSELNSFDATWLFHGYNLNNYTIISSFQRAAEAHLPVLESKEGIFISMDDLDGLHVWSFKYRQVLLCSLSYVSCKFWPNNNSRMYVLENTGEFVSTHGLQLGDFIMVYQDSQNQNYVIQAKKASDEDVYSDIARNGVNDLVLHDYEVGKSSYHYYPMMEDSGMSFIYDTTLSFSNDCPLDFLGGSMTNYSRMGALESFGSVENLSLDEFYQL
ncbi:hypothetical protein V6N11_023100 [Hibiscus sabdariffa]|uniref:TF-B3 domain-containing protein n=1 Tax=Hibiscus sabdariffa TaxID=183260 RepID=A0ABR2TL75_9ROSI